MKTFLTFFIASNLVLLGIAISDKGFCHDYVVWSGNTLPAIVQLIQIQKPPSDSGKGKKKK